MLSFRRVLASAAAVALAPLAIAQESAPNLLVNPSFEEGMAEGGGPTGWSVYGGLDEQRTLALADVVEGGRALYLSDGHSGEELGVRQVAGVEGTKAYIASVSVTVPEGGSTAGSFLQLRFAPSGEFVQRPLMPGLGGEPAVVRVGMVAPPGTKEATVYLYSHRGPTPSLFLDEARLYEVPELPEDLLAPTGAESPEIEFLKPLYRETPLVSNGTAITIVSPTGVYDGAAASLADAIAQMGGARPEIVNDEAFAESLSLEQHVIALGNRSTNQLLAQLYERYYSLLDLRYPGPGGYVVRTLHNPLGTKKNVILVGGSDGAGVAAAANAFARRIADEGIATEDGLSIGWQMAIQLGDGVTIPTDLREFETWDASAGYRSVGYFGWNSISKRMAMYYMTGDAFHAREALRLAFPDEQALAEIAEIDGERIENKDEPLSGPYHYNAHLMILYWDLIEESPVFTDEERLQVTRAFAKQLEHPGISKAYVGPSPGVPGAVGSRHGQWTALSLYCLGRYFAKDYNDPIWPVCEENGAMHFRSLHQHAWVQGESDNLFWYNTGMAPVLWYMLLTGDRVPLQNGVLGTLLRGQEILASGREDDIALRYGAISFFHQAAYLTGEGRWLEYLGRTGLDLETFRLGQSWWPGPELTPEPPSDLVDSWQVLPVSEPMWQSRRSGLPLGESFQFMSYRSAPDASGDFLLLDGLNGASRNPYHTFALLQLRQGGQTILDGYLNQVRTRADGLTEPVVAMDAALKHRRVLGETAVAVGEVPGAAWANWRRTVVNRAGQFTVAVDALTPRIDTENFEIQLSWESPVDWATDSVLPSRIYLPNAENPAHTATIQTSRAMDVQLNGKEAVLTWTGPASEGKTELLFSAIGQGTVSGEGMIASAPLGDAAAALRLPEPAIVTTGKYDGLEGALALATPDYIFGLDLREARDFVRADGPVDLAWDIAASQIDLALDTATTLYLAVESPEKLRLDRTPVPGSTENGWLAIALDAGRHRITGAELAAGSQAKHGAWLRGVVNKAVSDVGAAAEPAPSIEPDVPELAPGARYDCGETVAHMELLPSEGEALIAVAAGNSIHVITPDGDLVRTMATDGPIRLLRFWDEHRLLLAGCADEKVIAFDDDGRRAWEFVSQMDPAVYRAAKTYWFKSAPGHEGIHGLHTGVFLNGESQAFVGSACTLEILDARGNLVKRMPQFWGKVSLFKVIPTAGDTRTLLAGRKYNGYNTLGIINNATLDPDPRGFNAVPAGHTNIGGWSAMNRHHLFFEDFDGDGEKEVMSETNGTWNRVTVWDASGTAKYDASFGPGDRIPAKNIRDIDTGDLDGDGLPEIVVAEKTGLVVALEGTCERKWGVNVGGAPVVLGAVTPEEGAELLVVVVLEDGTVNVLDGEGALLRKGKVDGAPMHLLKLGRGEVALGLADGGVVVLDLAEE